MSSSEPPKIHRGHSHEAKAARDEITKRVEKVREVDPDEQARKRQRFRMMMGDEDQPVDMESQKGKSPSPFETTFHQTKAPLEGEAQPYQEIKRGLEAARGDIEEGFSDVADAILASPNYSPPPSLSAPSIGNDEEGASTALPQSEDFWQDIDSPPDQPIRPTQYQERSSQTEPPKGSSNTQLEKGKRREEGKGMEISPFGAPDKKAPSLSHGSKMGIKKKDEERKKDQLLSPFEEAAKQAVHTPASKKKSSDEKSSLHRGDALDEEKESQTFGLITPERVTEKKVNAAQKQEKERVVAQLREVSKEGNEEKGGGQKEHGKKSSAEIDISTLPLLPQQVVPMAQAAASVATPYLNPTTMALYYQMVGTIFVMTAPPGINRTEIVLNSPSFASSKFYGSTITIEKYATAPDSFNIRLTGSDTAVTAFKENLPNLMAAFQNGNFTFRINRLDAEYTLERPVFRRKEKREEKSGGDFGGNLGERK